MNHRQTPQPLPAGAVVQRLGPRGAEVPVLSVDGVAFDLRPVLSDITPAELRQVSLADALAAHAQGRLAPLPDAEAMRVGAPLAAPGKIVCIGLNYRDHAAETGAELPAEPVVFLKDPSTIGGPFDPVLIPRDSTKTDWEVELGVVIGTTARYLDSPEDALAHVAGYVLSHDVSEREFQLERGGQWDKGKSCETFNPLGPWIAPAASVADPQDLGLRLSVDGVLRQDGTTASMVFPVAHLVWYLSRFMVLHPGDLINTGTPAGVALGLPDHPYLRAGSVVELSIDGLGTARHRFEQAS
ncbi:2-keto-4-pentenoate hydratase/2-oxohepta-3-ene-1,7-dioic acid hydratase (catechol pathway) [Rathayibacter oskolensis]|uniref:2-keto-4-pentenoate hydratase/2-oxohepta-3-ene-1,7-dioic acid hydratase (Catechol pathway) n=1 Tax=Rathayibacter oskolensis TaxID=1891671 RepID=A0A1X7MV40_9MICO|nr:fumarylacetoacetate hydrolase family protein [Rathayibacter oskolensis]SMH28654.1 2-keto-4-pentenoate hydratase/2-oxohepta-3-ene-1,7-dioic acid hydratase (catechol pathway) [Rathayibacter oskolensis]